VALGPELEHALVVGQTIAEAREAVGVDHRKDDLTAAPSA
jgi:hypothetical protein